MSAPAGPGTALLVVDMHRALGERDEFFWDPIHFNPTGSRAAARVVAEALDPHLSRRAAQNAQERRFPEASGRSLN